MKMDRKRLANIKKWALAADLTDVLWLVCLAEDQERKLRIWEMIAERDHGKPPGRFQDAVEEIYGQSDELGGDQGDVVR